MLIQPTLDTLNQLKLHGMAIALSEQMTQTTAQSLPFDRIASACWSSASSPTARTGDSLACCNSRS